MKFILYTLLAVELATMLAMAMPLDLETRDDLEPRETLSALKKLHDQVDGLEETEVSKALVRMVESTVVFGNFVEENCNLAHFNQMNAAEKAYRHNKNIVRYLEYCRSEQLTLCNKKDPKFSTMIAMNGDAHYLNY